MVKNKWFKFTILYLGATALALSQIKMTPVQDNLGINLSSYGYLMSVFTFSALFLALPGGTIISKYGAKKIGIIVMAALVLGNIIGAFCVNNEIITNYPLLLVSRIIEGLSFAVINLIAMVFIGEWFKEGSSGIAIGIFGTFSALASLISPNLFPFVFQNYGLRFVWIITIVLSAIALLGFMFLLDDVKSSSDAEEKSGYKEVFADKNTWYLSIAMFTMTFVLYSFIAYYPAILKSVFNASEETVAANYSMFGLVGVPFGFIAGIIVDKFKIKPSVLGIVTGCLMALGCLMVIFVPSSMIIFQVAILSSAISMFSSSISISVPKYVKKPALIGQTFAVVYLFYYIGVTIGSAVIGNIAGILNDWKVTCIVMAIVVGLGIACMTLFHISTSKKQQSA